MSPIPTMIPNSDVGTYVGALFLGFVLKIIILSFAMWVVVLIDILKSDFKDSMNKLVWILLTFFIPILGSILYLFIGRKQSRNNNSSLKPSLAIVTLLFWYPLGIVLMWAWTTWPKWVKIILTLLAIILIIFKSWLNWNVIYPTA